MLRRALIAIGGTALLAAPSHAQSAETMSVAVRTADLDLASTLGRERLDRRIRQAAGQICGVEPRGIGMRVDFRRCHGQVLEDAAIQIARLKDRGAPIQVASRTR